jgi:hypothetical protein
VDIVTTYAAVLRAHIVHRLLQRHAAAFLVSLERMTLSTRIHIRVMARSAGFMKILVADVRKRNRVELGLVELVARSMEQNKVGLSPFESLGIFDSRDSALGLGGMTSGACDGACLGHDGVAIDTRPVCGSCERR